jgi:hypothetical protein
MNLKEYFDEKEGMGFLATANSKGEVDIAVYSRPKIMEDDTLAYGMADRLTHANLESNPHAVYAFHEGRFRGVRLFLEKVREETEGPLLEQIRKEADRVVGPGVGDMVKFVVYFRVKKNLPLVGG